jgi:hypothetical protein
MHTEIMMVRIAAVLFFAMPVGAQMVCQPVPRYSPCDLVFDIPSATGGQPLDLHAEFRSPLATTALVNAFHDGGTKWVIRFTPTESGAYTYRLTSALESLNGKQGGFIALPNNKAGWLRAANLHHFAFVEGNTYTPHLWTGGVVPGFASMDGNTWRQLADARAAQHFNHLAATLVDDSVAANFQAPEFYRAAEEKIRYANDRGIIIDLAFFGPNGLMNRLLPTREDRAKWFNYALSRLAAFDVTWQGLEGWETYDNGREVLKEIGEYEAALDPYKHIRSTRANTTSAPLADDGWLRFRSYQTADQSIAAVEQQMYQYPAVDNFGGDLKSPARDAATFRHGLWNATVDGQYPATLVPDEASANEMKVWYEFMEHTRHWELEPFFDSVNPDGSHLRGLALDGIEYVIYVEKPAGPVTVNVEPHGYDVEWINPASGDRVKAKKENKGEAYIVTPPENSHDWVLHISREGTKASMLKSVKFDSREQVLQLQEIEGNPEKVPFEIVEPSTDTLSLSQPIHFQVRLKRHTKALDEMMFEWTGEVSVDERSYRVIGTGFEGTFTIPANIAANYPAALHVRLSAMNGLGKVYVLDRNYTLNK